MKYPSHVILDIQTSTNYVFSPDMHQNYARVNDVLSDRELVLMNRGVALTQLPSAQNKSSEPKVSAQFSQSGLFNINFLRKEKLYTKLKYSRCPQYDIVSGGFAAILAGFIGFLISEKFGIELVDSGDFYNAFMYGVFAVFSLRPLITVYSKDDTPYSPLSPKYLMLFLRDLTVLAFKFISSRFAYFKRFLGL